MSDDIKLNVATCVRNAGAQLGSLTYKKTNNRTISGWTNVRVTRGIERCPSDFEISFTEPEDGVSQVIVQQGDWVQVQLGNDVVLTGFVDRYEPSISEREHMVRIVGRSLCQDLVDCAAFLPGGQILGQTVDNIAKTLCAYYGITVNVAPGTDVGAPIAQLNIIAGDSIYNVLEILCRYRGLLLYDQADGSLMLASGGQASNSSTSGPIGTRVAASGFTQGVNVKSASVSMSMDNRFSQYDAVYQGLDTCLDVGNGGNVVTTVLDSTVPRFRYHVIVSENVSGGAAVAEQRANWDLARRMGRSFTVRLTTDSWRDAAGVLYEPNTLVDIDLPALKLPKKRWLISEVTYKRNDQGTTADLVIMPPQAFYQEPIIINPVAPDIAPVNQ